MSQVKPGKYGVPSVSFVIYPNLVLNFSYLKDLYDVDTFNINIVDVENE